MNALKLIAAGLIFSNAWLSIASNLDTDWSVILSTEELPSLSAQLACYDALRDVSLEGRHEARRLSNPFFDRTVLVLPSVSTEWTEQREGLYVIDRAEITDPAEPFKGTYFCPMDHRTYQAGAEPTEFRIELSIPGQRFNTPVKDRFYVKLSWPSARVIKNAPSFFGLAPPVAFERSRCERVAPETEGYFGVTWPNEGPSRSFADLLQRVVSEVAPKMQRDLAETAVNSGLRTRMGLNPENRDLYVDALQACQDAFSELTLNGAVGHGIRSARNDILYSD